MRSLFKSALLAFALVAMSSLVMAKDKDVGVSLILETQWAPKLIMLQEDTFSEEFKMNVVAGTTYVIGGKVNPDASKEEQKNGTFWKPVI